MRALIVIGALFALAAHQEREARAREALEAKRKSFEVRSAELKPGSPARHFVSGRENGLADALDILATLKEPRP